MEGIIKFLGHYPLFKLGALPPGWPSPVLWIKFFRGIRDKVQLRNIKSIHPLEWIHLKELKKINSRLQSQDISAHRPVDQYLLNTGLSFWSPKEITLVRLHCEQGILRGKLYRGNLFKGASLKCLRMEMAKLTFKAKKRGMKILSIEILHTHPSLEVVIAPKVGPWKFIFNGLSDSDILVGQNLSNFTPRPLTIRAISPLATYSRSF